jgi:hypothetical protein
VSFNGSANITVDAAAGGLTGATLAAGVTASSLTSVGTLTSLTVGGTVALQDNELTRPLLADYAEKLNARGSISGAQTFDYSLGNVVTCTLSGNITSLTLSNPPASGRAATLSVYVTQDATGGRTIAWPGSVKWVGGTPPSLGTANQVTLVTLISVDGGTVWLGSYSGPYT